MTLSCCLIQHLSEYKHLPWNKKNNQALPFQDSVYLCVEIIGGVWVHALDWRCTWRDQCVYLCGHWGHVLPPGWNASMCVWLHEGAVCNQRCNSVLQPVGLYKATSNPAKCCLSFPKLKPNWTLCSYGPLGNIHPKASKSYIILERVNGVYFATCNLNDNFLF